METRWSYRLVVVTASALIAASCSGQTSVQPAAPTQGAVRPSPTHKSVKLTFYSADALGPSGSDGLVLGSDGNLWYPSGIDATSGAYTVASFSLSGETMYDLPPACSSCKSPEPTNLVEGPDGRAWFGTWFASAGTQPDGLIGAIDTSGNVTYYNGPPKANVMLGASSGTEIAFTSASTSSRVESIGYFDTATDQIIGPYATKNKSVPNLSTVALGPDGNFWFGAGKYVGRLTAGSSGTITLFKTAQRVYRKMLVNMVVSGPGPALWFIGAGLEPYVASMSTTGKMLSETTVETTGALEGLLVGPDKHVWVTWGKSGLIYMKSPRSRKIVGNPSQYADCSLNSLAIGPDGNLWFASASVGSGSKVCTYGLGEASSPT